MEELLKILMGKININDILPIEGLDIDINIKGNKDGTINKAIRMAGNPKTLLWETVNLVAEVLVKCEEVDILSTKAYDTIGLLIKSRTEDIKKKKEKK